jgi:hypothetical protein
MANIFLRFTEAPETKVKLKCHKINDIALYMFIRWIQKIKANENIN